MAPSARRSSISGPTSSTARTATTCRGPHSAIESAIGTSLAEMEQRAVRATLEHFGNDKPAAARALGISVRTVYNHLARSEPGGEDAAGEMRDSAA